MRKEPAEKLTDLKKYGVGEAFDFKEMLGNYDYISRT